MDRIDLQVTVNRLKPEEMTKQETGEPSAVIRKRVITAREKARDRFQEEGNISHNAQMQSQQLRKDCQLDDTSRTLLENAIRKLGLSARAMDRILKVARTIADLADAERIEPSHIAEAIQYRALDRA
jgi:magnesium chelatase family protein